MRKAFAKFSKAMSGEGNPAIAPPRLNPEDLAFLHGKIFVEVFEARNVEGKDSSAFSKLERAFVSSMDGVDPYCSVKLGYNTVFMTPVIDNDPNPVWNVSAELDVAHEFDALEFRLKAAKRKGPLSIISKVKHLSMLSIPATEILEKREIDGWFPLQTYRKEITAENPYDDDSSDTSESEDEEVPESSLGDIRIRVVYTPIHDIDLSQVGLLNSYYPPRGCVNNQLYQDADCPPGSIPEIPTYPEYRHGRCWIDLAQAIMESTEIIYITGWAVWPELVMVRTDYPGDQWKGKTLGEMLKKKAEDGVTVCVLVWDEVASNRFSKGIMGTHDEEVIHYFRRSKVHAAKVPRQNLKDGPFADLNDSLMFTHHQKTVIVSRFDSVTHKNRLEAYVGGLDLTDGRYDNNEHSLFRTLNGVHAPPDFWQACATGVQATAGPREPWHDIHSKVTGAAAWDILDNFESRWKGQLSERKHSALHPCSPDIFVTAEEEQHRPDGNWTVQILRSINQSSAVLDETRPGLITRRKASIDQSIHNAYIHQIRRAKSYIYIENQYFLGSSHMWDSKQRGGFSSHLVAIELAEKICAKIRANERFAVYVVVPMYPEGPPDSGAVQEILAHQRKTVSVITSRITATIRECGIDSSIGDWFNMFCLVNRESYVGGQGDGGQTDLEITLAETRRFMIYVHSKFAIFDDAVAITGSANINSRSMDGSRDSEIAAMSWQPEHTSSGSTGYGEGAGEPSVIPKGDVAAFRTALMMEHLGHYFYEMEDPASLECVHKICDLAKQNWEHFAADSEEPGDMPHGHLAYYPYMYDPDTGETLSSVPTFPDFDGALVKGQSSVIPNMLTG